MLIHEQVDWNIKADSQRNWIDKNSPVDRHRMISVTLRAEVSNRRPDVTSSLTRTKLAKVVYESGKQGLVKEVRAKLSERMRVVEQLLKMPTDENLDFSVQIEVDPDREYELVEKLTSFGPLFAAVLTRNSSGKQSLPPCAPFVSPTGLGSLRFDLDFARINFDQTIVTIGLLQTIVEAVESGDLVSTSDKLSLELEWEDALAQGLDASLIDHRGIMVSPAQWLEYLCYALEPYAARHNTEFILKVACNTLLYQDALWTPVPITIKRPMLSPKLWEAFSSLPSVATAATVAGILGFFGGFFLH